MAMLRLCIFVLACGSLIASEPCKSQHSVKAASLLQLHSSTRGQFENFARQEEAAFSEVATQTWRHMTDVVQSLAEKVAGHNYTMTSSEASALDTIRRYIQSMLNTTMTQHLEDQGEVNRARDLIQGCTDSASRHMTVVNGLKATMESRHQSHSSCRTTEAANKDSSSAACEDYENYRTTNASRVPPGCVSFKLTAETIGTLDATIKSQMEVCLEETKMWLDTLHGKYMLCKNETVNYQSNIVQCNSEQAVSEEAFCTYSSRLEDACDEQTACRARAVPARNQTHKAVAGGEAARKSNVEVGNRILCLFDVFELNNTDKSSTLSTCLNNTYDTSKYDITYHPIPAAVPCTKAADAQPCDEYESQVWYSKAPTTTCKACPAPAPAAPDPTLAPAPTGPASWVWDGQPKDWDDAVAHCQSKGLALVTPHTAEEKDAFFEYASERRSQITGAEWWWHEWWVGTYKEANCTFYNVDGTDFNPGTWFWLSGEPNGCPHHTTDKMCSDTNGFQGQTKNNFGFNDQICSYKHQFLCGQPAPAATTSTTSTTTAALISKVGSASCTDITVDSKVYRPCYCYANDGSHYPPSLTSLTAACGDAMDLVVGGKKCANNPGEGVQLNVGPLRRKFRDYLTEHKVHTDFDAAGKYRWYTEVYGPAQGDREGMGWIMLKDALGNNYWVVSTYYRQIADRAHLNAAWGNHGEQLTSVAGQSGGQPCVGDEYYIWMRG